MAKSYVHRGLVIAAVVPITCDSHFNCVATVSAYYNGTISFAPGH